MRRLRSTAGIRPLTLLLAGAISAPAAGQAVEPDEYASRAVARVAFLDLRARPMPTPDDYMIAERLLDTAAAFQPSDAELLRMQIRAAWAAGDSDRVDELTRRLVLLDPADTVAQLRLASSRVRRLQTTDERLRAYDRLLGPEGRAIDPSVRSRLALDAALLCREGGDIAGFAERLTQATQLDGTNKEAAALTWSFFGPLVESRPERLELLLNLLNADPTDPLVHRQVATELAMGGAFVQARRFHGLAVSLYTALSPQLDERVAAEASVIRWQVEGPKAVVESLNRELLGMRQAAAMQIMQWEQARMPTDSLPKPETIMLAPLYNQIRLVAAIMAGDRETIGATLADMGAVLEDMVKQAARVAELATPEERAQRAAEIWGAISQQLIAVAWADASTEALTEWAERSEANFGADADMTRMLKAWAELRLGDPAVAEQIFRALPESSTLNRVGLALTLERLGRTEEAAEVLRRLAIDAPLSLAGVWAREQYTRATQKEALASPEQAELVRLAGSVPQWVDRMAVDPRTFMSLSAELVDTSIPSTGRAALRVRLTNLAPRPLGVGGDRILNSRLLLSPKLELGTGQLFAKALPEVAELDRRLRLMPAESLEVVLWPDPGMVGWIAEVGGIDTVRERWRVLQGYTLDAQGVPTPGVLCFETETQRLTRPPLELGRVPATELADALDAAPAADLPGVVAAIRARALLEAGHPYVLAGDDLNRVATIAADRYTHMPPAARATMLAVLPTARAAPGMEPFDAAALAEEDPLLVPLALATRVAQADDAALAPWLESEAAEMRVFARALRTRLSSPQDTYSRLGAAALGAASAGESR